MRNVVLLGCLACAPKVAPVAPSYTLTAVDVADLYGGAHSASVLDRRLVPEGLMTRVHMPADLLDVADPDVPIEAWTRQVLLTWLGREGSQTLLGRAPDAPEACAERCTRQQATAHLRGLRFTSGQDDVAVVVKRREDGLVVGLRQHAEEESLCPAELSWPLHYVQLQVAVQRADGVMVGWFDETAVLGTAGDTTMQVTLPDGPDACEVLTRAFTTTPELQPDGWAYQDAAHRVLLPLTGLWRDDGAVLQ